MRVHQVSLLNVMAFDSSSCNVWISSKNFSICNILHDYLFDSLASLTASSFSEFTFFVCFTFLANFITTISFHRQCSMPYHFVSVICQTINIYRYKLYRARTNTLHSMLRINTRCRHECRLDTQQNSIGPATYASITIATSNHIYCIDV